MNSGDLEKQPGKPLSPNTMHSGNLTTTSQSRRRSSQDTHVLFEDTVHEMADSETPLLAGAHRETKQGLLRYSRTNQPGYDNKSYTSSEIIFERGRQIESYLGESLVLAFLSSLCCVSSYFESDCYRMHQ